MALIDEPRLLFVCTANINRSPMAAALLAHRLRQAGRSPRIASAGLLRAGDGAAAEAVATLAQRGVDLGGHRTRRLSGDLIDGADLVLGMENRHVRAVAVLRPVALDRAFTLKDFLRRATAAGPRRPDEAVVDYLARLTAGRDLASLRIDDPVDAVADPVGRPREAFERCADELEGLVGQLLACLWHPTVTPAVGAPTAQLGQRPR